MRAGCDVGRRAGRLRAACCLLVLIAQLGYGRGEAEALTQVIQLCPVSASTLDALRAGVGAQGGSGVPMVVPSMFSPREGVGCQALVQYQVNPDSYSIHFYSLNSTMDS